jgi:zinc transporter
MEERLLAKHVSVSRSELGSLRRMLVRLQRLLAPEPAAFFRLLSRPPEWITEEELQNLQQAAEKFSTAISDTAALVERVKQLQEELAAFVNEQTNRTLFVLTLVTVLALTDQFGGGLVWHERRWYSFSSTPVRFLFGRESPAGIDSVPGVLGVGQTA